MNYNLKFNIQLDLHDQCEHENHQELHLYLASLTPDSTDYFKRDYEVIDATVKNISDITLSLNVNDNYSPIWLCCDLYSHLPNEQSTPCLTRIGSKTHYISNIQSKNLSLKIHSKNTFKNTAILGNHSLKMEIKLSEIQHTIVKCNICNKIKPDKHTKLIKEYIEKLHKAQRDTYNKNLKNLIIPDTLALHNKNAKNKFTEIVNMPIYDSRYGKLPGISFWINSTLIDISDEWFHKQIYLSLRRYSLTEDTVKNLYTSHFVNFCQDKFRFDQKFLKLGYVLISIATSLINTYPYITDFIYQGGVKQTCESFDNIFVRETGDCEDLAKGIYQIISKLSTRDESKIKLVKYISKIAQLYVPCGTLGEVNNTCKIAREDEHRQAHMWFMLIPRIFMDKHVLKKEKPEYYPWEKNLHPLVGEGTGYIETEPSNSNNAELTKLTRESLRGLLQDPNIYEIENSSTEKTYDHFYNSIIHLFTDYYYRTHNLYSFEFTPYKGNTYAIDINSFCKPVSYIDKELNFISHKILSDEKDVARVKQALCFMHPTPSLNTGSPRSDILRYVETHSIDKLPDFKVLFENSIEILDLKYTSGIYSSTTAYTNDIDSKQWKVDTFQDDNDTSHQDIILRRTPLIGEHKYIDLLYKILGKMDEKEFILKEMVLETRSTYRLRFTTLS